MPPHFCIGVFGTRLTCNLSRANPGNPISIRGPCKVCNEMRCSTHCLCGRRGSAHGRAAARPLPSARPRAAPLPAPVSVLQPARPVGRPAAECVAILGTQVWWTQLLRDVGNASEVSVSTLLFDHAELTNVLATKLRRQSGFRVELFVHKESFEAHPPIAFH